MSSSQATRSALRIAGIYLLLGLGWILVSDVAVALATEAPRGTVLFQGLKGTLFVVVTAGILGLLVAAQIRAVEAAQREKQRVFLATMAAVAHILNNHLNSMLYFKLCAEGSGAMDAKLVAECEGMIFQTSEKIRELAAVEDLDPATLERFMT